QGRSAAPAGGRGGGSAPGPARDGRGPWCHGRRARGNGADEQRQVVGRVPRAGGGSVRRRPQHGLEHRPVDPRAVRGDARPAVSLLAAPQPARDRAGEGRGRNRQPNRGRRSVGDGGDRARRDRRGGRPAFFGALDGGGTAPSRGCDPDGGGRGRGDGDGNLRFHGTDERVHGRDVHDVP